jgi:hypothetical protein
MSLSHKPLQQDFSHHENDPYGALVKLSKSSGYCHAIEIFGCEDKFNDYANDLNDIEPEDRPTPAEILLLHRFMVKEDTLGLLDADLDIDQRRPPENKLKEYISDTVRLFSDLRAEGFIVTEREEGFVVGPALEYRP